MSSERACMFPPSIWLWGNCLANFYFWEENGWTPVLHFTAGVWYLLASSFLTSQTDSSTHYWYAGWAPWLHLVLWQDGVKHAQNPLFAPVLRLYLAGSPGTWTKRSCSMFQLSPQLAYWWNWPQSLFDSKEIFPRDLCCFYISSTQYIHISTSAWISRVLWQHSSWPPILTMLCFTCWNSPGIYQLDSIQTKPDKKDLV